LVDFSASNDSDANNDSNDNAFYGTSREVAQYSLQQKRHLELITSFICERTKSSYSSVQSALRRGYYVWGYEAVEHGFVDRVREGGEGGAMTLL
jgi:ATP-dependent protease ClpP protease subunit